MAAEGGAAKDGQTSKDMPELPKPELHVVDMPTAEADFAIEVAKKGVISLFKNERRSFCEVAQFIKKEFDKTYSGAWHVLVGKHFGAWVTHEAHKIIISTSARSLSSSTATAEHYERAAPMLLRASSARYAARRVLGAAAQVLCRA
eukprot:CAMPEP_0183436108 /NCGR_PEP_ID=MMETSP0370-20130417/69056_1 /TAXON_ID=268820 /ORGANISM="Peridinium aciculiferum, Strain PAER-2" /LENGTH=145 /DNA_ID=CAMNT_0025623453 /DNA_START=44 /DNA_END=482 /DNA_ORIENTATION=+